MTATVAFVLAGIVKGVLGFGFPIIALVVLTMTSGLIDALALIVVPTIVTNVWQALSGPHLAAILQRMGWYFAIATIGILVSSQFLAIINVNWLTALLGIILFFFALSRLFSFQIKVPAARERPLSIVLGAANGLLTGLTGTFMVPSVMYMQALGFGKDMLVQAMGAFFALSTVTLTLSLGGNGLISPMDAALSTLALIPAFAGIRVGRFIRQRINEDTFQKCFLVAILSLGAYLVWRSVAALLSCCLQSLVPD